MEYLYVQHLYMIIYISIITKMYCGMMLYQSDNMLLWNCSISIMIFFYILSSIIP